MPRKVFQRRGSGGSNEPLSVSTAELNQQRRETVEPGDYGLVVEKAQLSRNRLGNTSVVFEFRDRESGSLVRIRPLWIHGPNADRGTFAADNATIVKDMLEVAGHAPGSYAQINDQLLATLVGWTFDLQLILQPGTTGETCNAISAVNGGDNDVVPLRTPAAG
jgi:hypothetical protein